MEQVLSSATVIKNWDINEPYAQVGMEYLFKENMLETLLDFVLQGESPIKDSPMRVQMGGTYAYSQPNFGTLITVCTTMLSQAELTKKYPPTEACKQMSFNKTIINQLLDDNSNSKAYKQKLESLCKGNFEMSRKVAKILYKKMNDSHNFVEKVIEAVKSIKLFLTIDDDFKVHRCEWLLGIPVLECREPYRGTKYQFAGEMSEINDDAYKYRSTLEKPLANDCMLALMIKQRGRQDQIVIYCVKTLMKLSLQDPVIARYVHDMLPPTY